MERIQVLKVEQVNGVEVQLTRSVTDDWDLHGVCYEVYVRDWKKGEKKELLQTRLEEREGERLFRSIVTALKFSEEVRSSTEQTVPVG